MRIALIADLHGNRPATLALETDLANVKPDEIWCLGDVVGKGPSNDFTCDWAFEHCKILIAGNWDIGASNKLFWADEFYWNQLGEERMERLKALPIEHSIWISGRRVRLMHGRPIMEKLLLPQDDSEKLYPMFDDGAGGRYDVVVYADTHRQGMRSLSPGFFINTGSVGNSLGETHCCYAVLEGEPGKTPAPFAISFRQVEYDREQAVADALAAEGLNRADAYINEVRTGVYSRKPV